MGEKFDLETIQIELPQIHSSEWYRRLVYELRELKEYKMQSFLSCVDQRELGRVQGAVTMLDNIINKITTEE